MEQERRIPSLQYLCLKKIHEENPVEYKNLINKRQEIFDELDQVLTIEMKMRKQVKQTILLYTYDPIIVGSVERRTMPKEYQAYFSSNQNLDECLGLLGNNRFKINIISDYIGVWYLPKNIIEDKFRHVKLLISKDVDLNSDNEKSQYEKTHPINFILKFVSRTNLTKMSKESIWFLTWHN